MKMRKYLSVLIKRSTLLVVAGLMVITSSYAQFVYDYKKSADMYYAKADYYSAAVYYEKHLETNGSGANTLTKEPYFITDKPTAKQRSKSGSGTDRDDIVIRLADSYRLIRDFGNAEKWYTEAVKTTLNNSPDTQYWYAVSLRANGKYAEAKQAFEQYISAKANGKSFLENAKLELINTQFAMDQMQRKDLGSYSISKAKGLNGEGANYAASWSGNTLSFTSTRPNNESSNKDKTYKNALYQTSGSSGNVEKINIANKKGTEQGVGSYSASGNRLYFTRWVKNGDNNKSEIYFSENKEGAWMEPVKLNEQVNMDGYSAQQPFITTDGKYLVFSSDRPGGQGKFDLWYSELNEEGKPTDAINLGQQINTSEDEQAPFYHESSNTLVFSSKGKVGLGGFDFFASKGNLTGGWEQAENMGYPVNSSKDDLYFTNKVDSDLLKNALISSDRASQCCLELFTLTKTEAPKEIAVVEKKPEPVVVEKPKTKEQKAYFDFDKSELTVETVKLLDRFTQILKSQDDFGLEITGYTDNKGSDEYNQKLSERRANACKDYLVKAGIVAERIKTSGQGKSVPSGDDAKDRKAEFRMLLVN